MDDSYNIFICGVGGQGIIKTSVIIGEAAMNEGYNVSMSEIHGMSQRGGIVSTELKIGDYKSSVIESHCANLILGFEPIEIVRSLNKANNDTKLIFNIRPIVPSNINSQTNDYPNIEKLIAILKDNYEYTFPIDANKIAEDVGSIVTLNMVLLGSAIANNDFILSKKSIIESMKSNLRSTFHEMNLNAIEMGYEAVKNIG
ncbi:indolepyruvate oxidoreductase subunit beta [Methanobrevibacter filiformis]|uniref:Indolepyruvate oxidoreductase subunit beta n=1 Tax=Methanobrevibacter filiformis TaxID=55758 RepID=A0A166AH91_9EURY|nr:indolepyruvate oxidoreductase subunit beta [Methanobrevibacter filiformis]KZX12029.1 indolepyruvate oxidoreductase subunit beta [Methanobrevibacter filiformis]